MEPLEKERYKALEEAERKAYDAKREQKLKEEEQNPKPPSVIQDDQDKEANGGRIVKRHRRELEIIDIDDEDFEIQESEEESKRKESKKGKGQRKKEKKQKQKSKQKKQKMEREKKEKVKKDKEKKSLEQKHQEENEKEILTTKPNIPLEPTLLIKKYKPLLLTSFKH